MSQEKESKVISQWTSLNNTAHMLKVICLGLIGICIVLGVLCFFLRDKTPIVVQQRGDDFFYLVGMKERVPLKKDNIRRFIQSYVSLRYDWGGALNLAKVSRDIAPFVTRGFRKKTEAMLKNLKLKEFKDKKLDQGHTRPRVRVSKKSTVAQFERVFKIDGVPIPIPTQISFELVRGEVSVWNPLGLYINGTSVHEGL